MKRLIALRKRYKAFGRGTIEFLYPENRKVLVFVRKHEDETILVVANLSRFAQFAELDMSKYKGATPVELFGRTEFPKIGELPYFITLGPHAFYWFELKHENEGPASPQLLESGPRVLTARADWQELLIGRSKGWFEAILPEFLQKRRWFGGKARAIQSCLITEVIDLNGVSDEPDARLLLVKIEYVEGEPETYQLLVAFAAGEQGERALAEWPDSVIARVQFTDVDRAGVIYEATANRDLLSRLFDAIARRRKFKGRAGQVVASPTEMFRSIRRRSSTPLDPTIARSEQSNTSVIYGDRMILKLLRRPDAGVNPELEIGRFLNEHAPHASTPRLAGFLEYQRRRAAPITLAILQEYVKNEGDAWSYTLDSVTSYLEGVLSGPGAEGREAPLPEAPVTELMNQEPPQLVSDLMGQYLRSAELLGKRTGELHVALASATEEPAFNPEPFTPFYQRAIYQAMRSLVAQVFPTLRRKRRDYEPLLRDVADSVLSREDSIMRRFRSVIEQRLTGSRIRIHGDFHLGQVLYTGKDFTIIDFEGEPARPLSERRLKRSPLRDAAGMLRSFHYAAYSALYRQSAVGMVRPEQFLLMETWARYWHVWASAGFLRGYMHETGETGILPETQEELKVLLDACILEKAIYELGYELNNRPEWVRIPLSGILHLLESPD